jgi:arylsulfatase I/J
VGFHRDQPTPEVVTPNLDGLARSGCELDRHYTYKFCSPSRSSFLSGRLPVHVNIYNDDPALYNATTGASAGVCMSVSVLRRRAV